MLGKVIIENGVKKIQALTADTGTGAPVGSYLYLEKKSNPQGYLYCDGSTFDETVYPALYQYLGSNVLPDFREFSPVGAEQNTTNVYDAQTNPNGVIHDHDVYTEGQEKDDQLQGHSHNILDKYAQEINAGGATIAPMQVMNTIDNPYSNVTKARAGTVTRGKRKAVFVYIKATSGLTENQQENVLNTINENNSYSTEEHPTGKKWIDGKPIYSKVIEVAGLSSGVTDINHGANIDKLISNNGYCEIYSQNRPFPFIDDGGNSARIATYSSEFIRISTNYPVSNLAIVLEYTKTTDN